MGAANVTVYAQWQIIPKTITYTMTTGSFTSPTIDTTGYTKMTVTMSGCAHGENSYFDGTWHRMIGINGNFMQGSTTYGWTITPYGSSSAYLMLNGATSAYVKTSCTEGTYGTKCNYSHTITVTLE